MSVAPQADAAVGAVLNGEWRLLRLIGEGGLAAVYEAENLQGKGRRAVKLLHAHFQSQRPIVERFYAEAKACFSLSHPHIANTEAYAYAEDGSPYIVMELLKGFSLEELLRKRVPMAVEQAAPVMYGVLQAIGAAHAAGIVHRDVKPANLFLVPQSNGQYAPKVLDFGIAKVMDLAGGMGTKTRTGAVLGTPGYMAPEQIKNAKAVDLRTDLWAVGVVFYEMLCCEHPYGNADQFARMVAVLRDDPKSISQINPELIEWDQFFERALSRTPDDRFQDSEEMANALRDIAQGTTAHFVPTGSIQTIAMPVMPDMMYGAQSLPSPAQPNQGRQNPTQTNQASPATHNRNAQPHAPRHPSQAPAPTHRSSAVTGVSGVSAAQQATARAHAKTAASPQIQAAQMGRAMPGSAMPVTGPQVRYSTPPAIEARPNAAPEAGARRPGSTQVSGPRSGNLVPEFRQTSPQINIVEAADEAPPSLVWWGVLLVGIACTAAGFLIGYLVGAS